MITEEIKNCVDKSVLCWLATSSADNLPNVSPKEVFAVYGDKHIIVANIASPQTMKNIVENNQVCISFIDILVQKGFQLKGTASIIRKSEPEFVRMKTVLEEITKGLFPFSSIIEISVEKIKPIIAPKYVLYPGTSEAEQIDDARRTYGF